MRQCAHKRGRLLSELLSRDDPTPARGNQLTRTASLILASLSFVHDLRTGVLEPDTVRGSESRKASPRNSSSQRKFAHAFAFSAPHSST